MFRSSLGELYPWLRCFFYSQADSIRRNRCRCCLMFRRRLPIHSEVEKIVHRMPEVLFAAEIAFRGLHRCMPEQKLNLLEFTTAVVAQLRTRPAQVVRGDSL